MATSERYPILKRSYWGRAAHPGLSGAHGEDGLSMANPSLLNHLAVELRDTIKNQDSGAFKKHFWAFKNGTKSRSFKSIIKSHKLSFRDHGQQNTMNKLRHSHHPAMLDHLFTVPGFVQKCDPIPDFHCSAMPRKALIPQICGF